MTFRHLFFAAVLALSSQITEAVPVTGLVVFGDSLSDTGNVTTVTGGRIPGPPYFQGRASNGPLYIDVLAAGLGVPLIPSRVDLNGDGVGDGNNFAYGGARTNRYPFPFDGRSLLGQLQEFQSRGQPVDPRALFVVYGGANNVQDALNTAAMALGQGQDPATVVAAALAAIHQGVLDIETILTTLANLGATEFLVPNLPNVALVPRIRELGNPSLANLGSTLGVAFNTELGQFLNAFDDTHYVARLDVFSLFQQRVANPAAFGLTNVTDRCYTGDDIGFTGGGTICATPDTFLFWDGIHPTARIHAELGQAALAALPEPGTALLLIACAVVYAVYPRRRSAIGRERDEVVLARGT